MLLLPIPLAIAVGLVDSDGAPGWLDALLPDSFTSSDFRLLVVAVVLQVTVVVAGGVHELVTYVLSTHTGERLTLAFRTRLFRHVQRLSLSFHDSRGTADSIYRIQYDAISIQYITIDGLIPIISAGVTLVAMLYVIGRLDWQLGVVALGVAPLLFLSSHVYVKRMRGRYHDVKGMESYALKVVQEVLTALRVVKAFGREDNEQDRFVRHSADGARAKTHLSFSEGVFGLLVNTITAVGMAAVLFIGIRNVQAGTLKLPELLVIIAYLQQLYAPLKTISKQVSALQSSIASADRAFELLDEVSDVVDRPHARGLERAAGDIEFRNVGFAYDGKQRVIEDVSFHLSPGRRLGVAGRTGAGKTTLLSLLTRFYDVSDGQILLDGLDLREYKLADLRNQFGIVLQEPVLFSATIAENIAYARPGASEEEIAAAAGAANAHDFIAALPDGYETLVGERGMRLSGGERQRVSLARAFLKDAPILILDEPTSSVDTKTEAVIIEAMQRLMRGRTTIMIAHRLSTLDSCDAVLELENGRVVTGDGSGRVIDLNAEPGVNDAWELPGESAVREALK
jgi:ATP-binding cassette subfamily B protein